MKKKRKGKTSGAQNAANDRTDKDEASKPRAPFSVRKLAARVFSRSLLFQLSLGRSARRVHPDATGTSRTLFLFRETLLIITGHESWDMYGLATRPKGWEGGAKARQGGKGRLAKRSFAISATLDFTPVERIAFCRRLTNAASNRRLAIFQPCQSTEIVSVRKKG